MNRIRTILNRLIIISTLLIGIVSFAFCSSSDNNGGIDPPNEWHEAIKIGTYNIRFEDLDVEENSWTSRNVLLEKLLKKYDFDILGTQEPFINQINDMLVYLTNYSYVGTSTSGKPNNRRHFNAIFYKKDRFTVINNGEFWLSETPDVPNVKGWDANSVRMCTWVLFKDKKTNVEFYHFNVHFDHIGVEARKESSKLIIAKIKEIAKDKHVVLTGDLNSNQNSEAYHTIISSGILVDSYKAADKKDNADWHTLNRFDYFSTPPTSASRIDHIFITQDETKLNYWKIINDSYSNKYPSDHYPVIVEWSFKKQNN